jgi:hypothetical protein
MHIYCIGYEYDLNLFIEHIRTKQHYYMFGTVLWIKTIPKYVDLIYEFEHMSLFI